MITCVNVTKFRIQSKEAAAEQQAQPGQTGTDACAAAAGSSEQATAAAAAPGSHGGDSAEPLAGTGDGTGAGAEAGTAAGDEDWAGRLLGQPLARRLHAEVLLPAVERFGVDEAGEWGE